LLFPRSDLGKIMLLTFIAAYIPLLVLIVYTVFVSGFDAATTISLLLVALGVTMVGTAVVLGGLWVLLTPLAGPSLALERYRRAGTRIEVCGWRS